MTNNKEYPNETKQGRRHTIYEKWKQTSLPNRLLIIFTAVIATANLIYATLLLWQLFILQEQLIYIQEVSHLDQRAWIGIETIAIEPIKTDKKKLSFHIVFINTGKTPAINIKMDFRISIHLKEDDIPTFFEQDNLEHDFGQAFLTPNGRLDQPYEENMIPSIIEAIESGKTVLWVLVKIEYYDIFRNVHKTHVCLRYYPKIMKLKIYDKFNYID